MILFTIEHLYHFQCQQCKSWWSIGDYQQRDAMACPSCGVFQGIEPMSKEQQDKNMRKSDDDT